ncbi:hypothetical protein Tco_1556462 [Tanacetum coccineum]
MQISCTKGCSLVVRAKVAKNAGNKRKWEDNQKGNFGQQQNKRHEVVRAYTVRPNDKRGYVGTLPFCNKCKLHHNGPFPVQCMDWLSKYHGEIICDEKLVRIPYDNETLTIQGDKNGSRLNIISCIKTQNYLKKGCHVILAHVMSKKSEDKRLEDVPVVRDFPKVFLEDLPGLPPTGQVEF